MMIFTDQYSTLFSSVYLNCYWHMMETLSWKNTRQFFRRFPKPLKSHIVDYRGIVKTTALREKISCSELCSSSYMAFLRTAIPSKISCPLLRDKSSECSSSFSSMGRSVHFKWKKILVFTDKYSHHVIVDIFASISMRIGRTSNGGSTLKLIQCL